MANEIRNKVYEMMVNAKEDGYLNRDETINGIAEHFNLQDTDEINNELEEMYDSIKNPAEEYRESRRN